MKTTTPVNYLEYIWAEQILESHLYGFGCTFWNVFDGLLMF